MAEPHEPRETSPPRRRVLITGAAGYLGRIVTSQLARQKGQLQLVVASDVRPTPRRDQLEGISYEILDICDGSAVSELVRTLGIDTIVHLAAVVTPPRGSGRELAYRVDVRGTESILEACVAQGVRKLIFTSSGAAYGYHADSPPLLDEGDPLRGNEIFAYAHHKRLVEQLLERHRQEHPELEQLVFRPGVVIGESVHNQITAMFERPFVLGLAESASPFVFIWDEDVAACIVLGVHGDQTGIFNLAGDGVMTLREIARALGKPFVALPAAVVRGGLGLLDRLGLAPYGPEQVMFLEHRPVLSNARLKRDFGYVPLSSREAFDRYLRGRRRG